MRDRFRNVDCRRGRSEEGFDLVPYPKSVTVLDEGLGASFCF